MKKKLDIKEIQTASLNILKRVADFCDEHNIYYVLAYGTLIGAVRHKGFIPWDDDIDIMMPRPDYDRFINLFCKENDDLQLVLFNQDTCNAYPYGITRISDIKYEIHTVNEKDCGMGLFIDIYPLDGIGLTHEEGFQKLEESHVICDKLLLLTRKKLYCPQLPNVKKQIVYICKKIQYMLKGKKSYYRQLQDLISQANYDNSNYVGCLAWIFNPARGVYKKSLFMERIKMQFEDSSFYVPKGYDEILRTHFGDYMQLPPVEKRIYHHGYVAYIISQ